MVNRLFALVLLIILLFGIGCTQTTSNNSDSNIPDNKQCIQDSDCVPDACCHAKSAVNSQYAPNCKDISCTMSCEPETFDCGQGKVECVEGQCVVTII